jgi:hypothetical protein
MNLYDVVNEIHNLHIDFDSYGLTPPLHKNFHFFDLFHPNA